MVAAACAAFALLVPHTLRYLPSIRAERAQRAPATPAPSTLIASFVHLVPTGTAARHFLPWSLRCTRARRPPTVLHACLPRLQRAVPSYCAVGGHVATPACLPFLPRALAPATTSAAAIYTTFFYTVTPDAPCILLQRGRPAAPAALCLLYAAVPFTSADGLSLYNAGVLQRKGDNAGSSLRGSATPYRLYTTFPRHDEQVLRMRVA